MMDLKKSIQESKKNWMETELHIRKRSEDERSDLHDHRTQHEDPGSGAAQQRACRMQFSKARKKIRQVKAGNKAATQYYKNMQQMDAIPPQFLDKKK